MHDSFFTNPGYSSDFKFRLSKEDSNTTGISSLEMQWRKWRRVPLPVMYQSSDNHHLHSMGSSLPSKQVFMNKQICEQILNRQLFWLCYKGMYLEVRNYWRILSPKRYAKSLSWTITSCTLPPRMFGVRCFWLETTIICAWFRWGWSKKKFFEKIKK